MLYTSIKNEKIKNLKKLTSKKYRDETGLFLVETWHLINEAYACGFLDEILLKEGKETSLNVKVNYASSVVLNYLSNISSSCDVIGICHKKEEKLKDGKILMLDNVQDPGNIGTIIRSSVAFNVDTLILSEDCADIYNDKVIRSSQGMIFKMNIIRADLKEKIIYLKENGYKIFGSKVDLGKSPKNVTKSEKFAIIMGNEGKGISNEILNLCDEYIYIKTNDNCESLNVGVATSIILYELE